MTRCIWFEVLWASGFWKQGQAFDFFVAVRGYAREEVRDMLAGPNTLFDKSS